MSTTQTVITSLENISIQDLLFSTTGDSFAKLVIESKLPLPILNQFHYNVVEIFDWSVWKLNVQYISMDDESVSMTLQLSCCVDERAGGSIQNPIAPVGGVVGADGKKVSYEHCNLYAKVRFPHSFFSERELEVLGKHSDEMSSPDYRKRGWSDKLKVWLEGGLIQFRLKPWTNKDGEMKLSLTSFYMEGMQFCGSGFGQPGEPMASKVTKVALSQPIDWSAFLAQAKPKPVVAPVAMPTAPALTMPGLPAPAGL